VVSKLNDYSKVVSKLNDYSKVVSKLNDYIRIVLIVCYLAIIVNQV
jgi:hypothetical protein